MSLHSVVARAEKLLPGKAAPNGQDPRWQAIIDVSEFIPTHPDEVWSFASRWGCADDDDLRDAIATCVLEHLLEHHFESMFPRVEELARSNSNFALTFRGCSKFGQSELPENSKRFDRLSYLLSSRS
jgi:hypothetical protein